MIDVFNPSRPLSACQAVSNSSGAMQTDTLFEASQQYSFTGRCSRETSILNGFWTFHLQDRRADEHYASSSSDFSFHCIAASSLVPGRLIQMLRAVVVKTGIVALVPISVEMAARGTAMRKQNVASTPQMASTIVPSMFVAGLWPPMGVLLSLLILIQSIRLLRNHRPFLWRWLSNKQQRWRLRSG